MTKLVAVLFFCAALLPAQHSDTKIENPFNTAADREQGARHYREQCAVCHGPAGEGGAGGPTLNTGRFRRASSPDGLFGIVAKGIPGTSMPGFSLTSREIWQIVAHLGVWQSGTQSKVSGNAVRGKTLVASSGCLNCHAGTNAPSLVDAAARLSAAELRLALTNPDASVSSQYWRWTGHGTDGETWRGYRLNEDTFSLQILTREGELKSIAKSRLRSSELETKSPMPSYGEKLKGNDLDDVIAYLASLTGEPR